MASAKTLAMTFDYLLQQRTAYEIQTSVRDRFRLCRKEQKLSQAALANKADVSLGL